MTKQIVLALAWGVFAILLAGIMSLFGGTVREALLQITLFIACLAFVKTMNWGKDEQN